MRGLLVRRGAAIVGLVSWSECADHEEADVTPDNGGGGRGPGATSGGAVNDNGAMNGPAMEDNAKRALAAAEKALASAPRVGQAAVSGELRRRIRQVVLRVLMHGGFVLIAVGCFAAYAHLRVAGNATASLVSLVAAAAFGFAPIRDVIGLAFRIEGKALHLVHGLGGLALVGLPLAGVVSGAPLVNNAWRVPFAIMGAAQAVMHQNNSALSQVSTRFGANLGLDVVDLALSKLAANPATAGMVPQLRQQLAQARRAIAGKR